MTKVKTDPKRFDIHPNAVKVIFIPQCNSCKYNISGYTCKNFELKPEEYVSNEEDCPLYKKGEPYKSIFL